MYGAHYSGMGTVVLGGCHVRDRARVCHNNPSCRSHRLHSRCRDGIVDKCCLGERPRAVTRTMVAAPLFLPICAVWDRRRNGLETERDRRRGVSSQTYLCASTHQSGANLRRERRTLILSLSKRSKRHSYPSRIPSSATALEIRHRLFA
jgi:hypothetical protein